MFSSAEIIHRNMSENKFIIPLKTDSAWFGFHIGQKECRQRLIMEDKVRLVTAQELVLSVSTKVAVSAFRPNCCCCCCLLLIPATQQQPKTLLCNLPEKRLDALPNTTEVLKYRSNMLESEFLCKNEARIHRLAVTPFLSFIFWSNALLVVWTVQFIHFLVLVVQPATN